MGVMREKLQLAGMKLEVHRAQMEKKGFHKADMLLTDSDDAQSEHCSQVWSCLHPAIDACFPSSPRTWSGTLCVMFTRRFDLDFETPTAML